jgi:hypothetical protein
VKLWQQAADHDQLFALIELAKYYEHQEINLPGARYWTQAAIDVINRSDFTDQQRSINLEDLKHRLERLKKKAG